jgi:hypothetical protein
MQIKMRITLGGKTEFIEEKHVPVPLAYHKSHME